MDEWKMGADEPWSSSSYLTAGKCPEVWNTHPRNGTVAAGHVGDGEDTGRTRAHERRSTGRRE